jgi:hypothetical protein
MLSHPNNKLERMKVAEKKKRKKPTAEEQAERRRKRFIEETIKRQEAEDELKRAQANNYLGGVSEVFTRDLSSEPTRDIR